MARTLSTPRPGVPPAYLLSPAAMAGPAASEDGQQPLLTLLAEGGQVEFSNLGSCGSLACLWQTNFVGFLTANTSSWSKSLVRAEFLPNS